jgi:ABC-type multidrug transport system fused ATPase/permease subunit
MNAGVEKDKLSGNIAFRNVHFAYPARPDAKILSDFSLGTAKQYEESDRMTPLHTVGTVEIVDTIIGRNLCA